MTSPDTEKLHFTTKLAYGAGDFGPAIAANILVFYLLFFFTNVAGLPPGLAGSILMIGKISDAINDPIVGVLSDKTRTRWGRRLPWILGGMIPFALFYSLQWIIPQFSDDLSANRWGLFAYYVIIGIFFNIAYTTVNLPYTALTPELTQDYNERTSLNSFRFSFSIGGSILSLILYILVSIAYPDDPQRRFFILGLSCSILGIIALLWCSLRIQEKGREPILNLTQKKQLGVVLTGVSLLGIIYAILRLIPATSTFLGGSGNIDYISFFSILSSLLLLGFGCSLLFAEVENHLVNQEAKQTRQDNQDQINLSFFQQLKIVFNNRPFLFVIGIYLCSWLAVQLTASILVYFVVSYMNLGEDTSGLVALAVQGTALIMLFLWQAVCQKLDKKIVYFMGTGIWIIAQIGLFLLQPGQVTLMFILAILAGFGVSVAYLIPWSMVPDVIELDELETGQRREGVFYAFMVLLQKFGLALGLFLVGVVLEAAGFVEQIPGEPIPTQPETALFAIRIAVAPLPAIILIIGLILAYFYPITREVHAEIRLKLKEKHQTEREQL
ncbi:probable sodium/galactoside symporter protein [Crocosphaera subtropica ATCC 51142]|uniref:Probable sodium/galactoside symporter protein n=1 Tax=Crocosphaera subtropica (strain ATCC 51142 / BH68) TaxID=43989 RepID=B1WRJ8_CROS5|nr:MFS transporter [Crocosphaera subtropica]ACB51847.1 probable sodium/galactoside symporter protein [Crocosphaera subtropica ATCC 51142]